MKEIVRINLENEMDLILAHKRTMKLAELCGISHIVQTTFATAVSEIARCVIGNDNRPLLILGLRTSAGSRKDLLAQITYESIPGKDYMTAINYALRLASDVQLKNSGPLSEILLIQGINFSGLINDVRIESFIQYFKKELPLSPYDELRKKNIQLIELSEKLRDSENQYKQLTETLPLMVFTTNSSGTIIYANKWLKDFFALKDDANKLTWLNLVHVSDNDQVRKEWENAMVNKTTFRIQARVKAAVGVTPVWHLISVVPVKGEQNELAGWTGFFVDIHAQKRIEETLKSNVELKNAQQQLLNYQEKLEEKISELNKSNHDLEQFAYIASHDLQEPLRKIRTFAELLEHNLGDEEKRKKYLEKIDSSAERMTVLIKDVLNYSRLSNRAAGFSLVSLSGIIEAVKLDMELVIKEKKADIRISQLPEVNGISLQLHQLFYNLLSNSLKFSQKDPVITIEAQALTEDEIGNHVDLSKTTPYVRIVFKDNGIGFEQKYAGQIFTIFKRLNTREMYSGTGIGLALCKKIVDNHYGLISVESEPGKGTEFSIVLPME